jgi:hypothetical protein
LACEQTTDSVFNFTSNECEYDAKKACESSGDVWNPIANSCTAKVIPKKTLEQLKQECVGKREYMWTGTTCQELRFYLAEPYTQPKGAHDAYAKGDIIIWNNKYYESKIHTNVWSPSAYPAGWEVIS